MALVYRALGRCHGDWPYQSTQPLTQNGFLFYRTAGIDVVGTGLLVLAFAFLTVSGANDMSQQVAGQSQ